MGTKAALPPSRLRRPPPVPAALRWQAAAPGLVRTPGAGCSCGGGCPACRPSAAAGMPGDRHEQEADRAAARALQAPRPALATARSPQGSGAGQPLDEPLRAQLEAGFSHDFGQVRLHHDATAGASARRLHAQAYTLGADIVFGPGQYRPDTAPGQRLLAHELAHVVQQGAATPRGAGAQGLSRRAVGVQMAAGFPWQGVVATEAEPLTLRALPEVSTPSSHNAVGLLASGTAVTVLGGSKFNWLQVRGTTTEGATKEGFVLGQYVDDAGGGADAGATAGIPVSVDRITFVTSAAGAHTGYPAQNTAGESDLNRPGPFNSARTGECTNVHQVHFHLDQGDSAAVEPVRKGRAIWTNAGVSFGPGGTPVRPGGLQAQRSFEDGPPPHEVLRPSKDTLVVADPPGVKWLFAGDYPFKASFDFDLELWWKAGPAIAQARYTVELEKTDAANVPNAKNALVVLERQDLVRKRPLT